MNGGQLSTASPRPVGCKANGEMVAEAGCSVCGKPMKTGPYGVLLHMDGSDGHERVSWDGDPKP